MAAWGRSGLSSCTSPSASTQMPPRPSISTGPHCASRTAPTTSSRPLAAMVSTSTPSSTRPGAWRAMLSCSRCQACGQLVRVGDVQQHAAGLGLVRQRCGLRLQHHGVADTRGRGQRFGQRRGQGAWWGGQAGGGQQLLALPFGQRARSQRQLQRCGRQGRGTLRGTGLPFQPFLPFLPFLGAHAAEAGERGQGPQRPFGRTHHHRAGACRALRPSPQAAACPRSASRKRQACCALPCLAGTLPARPARSPARASAATRAGCRWRGRPARRRRRV